MQNSVWEFLKANWGEILIAVVFVASVVVKFTPSVKDNRVLKFIIGILDKLSVAQTADNREILRIANDNAESQKEEDKEAAK